jgi:ATPase subunit of ABC transporter with duplicated ATPase domains
VTCSGLAYAHPGGDLLFSDVSFRISPGDHVAVVGANGVGKSTLFRVLAGELPADDGEAVVGGRFAYMPQDVGLADDARSVRELLTSLAPRALRAAGERMIATERALAAGDDDAGVELGAAIGEWSGLGGGPSAARFREHAGGAAGARCGPGCAAGEGPDLGTTTRFR